MLLPNTTWISWLFLAIVAAMSTDLAHAVEDVYKWVDEEGVVHYGEAPPDGVATEIVELERHVRPTVPNYRKPSPRPVASKELPDQRQQQARADLSLEIEKRCSDGRRDLEILSETMPVYRNANGRLRAAWREDVYKGERYYLDDVEREKQRLLAAKKIANNCDAPFDQDEQQGARDDWVRSERCLAANAELAGLKAPGMRTPQQEIREANDKVRDFCSEPEAE